MSNVVSLKRSKDDLKDKVIEDIKANTNRLAFYISFPDENEEGKVFFYTNFEPGASEMYALETLLEYFRSQAYTIVEDS